MSVITASGRQGDARVPGDPADSSGGHSGTATPVPPRPGSSPTPTPTSVSGVLVVHNGSTWLAACLDAIARQTIALDRLVIVDVASTDTSRAIAQAHQGVRRAVADVQLVGLDETVATGPAIDHGIAALPEAAEDEWVWVLHDDSAPASGALAGLVEAVRRSPSVGVAGPKVVSWDDPRRLVELGIQITRTGRRIASPVRGEPDQGQHDGRSDVLAVTTSGMLVRRDVHAELGGFDASFDQYGADLDFGWRAQLAGHRVVVVPSAVVRDASARLEGERPGGPRPAEVERRIRLASRAVTLARCSPLAAPFLAVWMALSALVSALTLLVAKRPRKAWRELADIAVLAHPLAIQGARWRGRHTKRLRRSDLATLFVPPGTAARTTVDHIQDAITPERTRRRADARLVTETGPVAAESESLQVLPASLPRRIVTHPGFLAVVTTFVAALVAWRDVIGAGALSVTNTGIAGGQLRAVTTDAEGLWHAFRDAWHGAGLGNGTESGPYLALLAGITWLAERLPGVADGRSPAGVTIAWLLFLTPAGSAWLAYLAGRVVTPSRVSRAVVALAWGTAAVVTVGVTQGRVTAAIAHLVLPLVLAGFVLAARGDGTYTAAFATALAIAVLGSVAPPLLALAALAALLLLVIGPGTRRLRALVLLLVPAALLGPWLLRFVDDWRLLLSGPGLVTTIVNPQQWQAALGLPLHVPGHWVWLLAPVVLLGVAGYAVRASSRAESVGLVSAGLLAVIGLAIALGSARVVLGSAETDVGVSAPAHLWSGLGIDLWVAGLLVGLLVGGRPLLRLVRRPFRRWAVVGALAAVLLVLVPLLTGAARWAWTGIGETLTIGKATLPAVAVEQAGGPLSNRLLLLNPSDTVVDFQLVGQEPGDLLRDLDRPAESDNDALVDTVAALVGGRGDLDATALAGLAVAFVQVQAAPDTPLVRRLDASEGLSRLGASEHGILWKVQPLAAAPGSAAATSPSRVRLVDAAGRLLAPVPTVGPHAAVDTTVPAATGVRHVVFAQPHEWSEHAEVTLDGRVLDPVAGPGQPTYAIPATGGHLRADLAAAQPWWRLGQAALLAFVVFMAVPFGNRRSRRRT